MITNRMRTGVLVTGQVAASYFILRDEDVAKIVISTPVQPELRVGSVADNLPMLMQRAAVTLGEDIEERMEFFECHAGALDEPDEHVVSRLSFGVNAELKKAPVAHGEAQNIIRRCLKLANHIAADSPGWGIQKQDYSKNGGNVIPFKTRH